MTQTRKDGWTPQRRADFLSLLEGGATVAAAAAQVGMSREGAYRLRRRAGPAFQTAWDAAASTPADVTRTTLLDHLVNGTPVTRYYHGRAIGEDRHFDPRLMIAALRRWGGSRNCG